MTSKPTYEELESKIKGLEHEHVALKEALSAARLGERKNKLASKYAKALLREKSELSVSAKICQIIVKTGGYPFAWFAFAEADEANSIRPLTQVGFKDGHLESIKMSWSEAAYRDYPTSTAIRTGLPCMRTLKQDTADLPWRREAICNGYEASLALPLRINQQVFAVLTISSCEADAFDKASIVWWKSLADDLSFTIERLRREVRHQEIEQSLRRNEERETLAQQAAKIGIWEWDINSGGLFWSKQIYPIFGLTPGNSEVTYETFLACIPPEDRPHVEASVNAAVYEGKTYDIEHSVQHPDGSLHWVSERGSVFRDESGNPIRMVGVVQDVTERKQSCEQINTLRGMMPICSNCKKIRDTGGGWHLMETYVRNHSSAKFSHSICPECATRLYPEFDLDL